MSATSPIHTPHLHQCGAANKPLAGFGKLPAHHNTYNQEQDETVDDLESLAYGFFGAQFRQSFPQASCIYSVVNSSYNFIYSGILVAMLNLSLTVSLPASPIW